jgi:superfamily II DNA or RNA helicase
VFEELCFQHEFRKYQKMMLAQLDNQQADRRWHLVAPPGSGKTIVGLELIRRFRRPAVVFAPTTTIQEQWRDKLAMFTASGTVDGSLVSTDPRHLAPVNVFTYQLISTRAKQANGSVNSLSGHG